MAYINKIPTCFKNGQLTSNKATMKKLVANYYYMRTLLSLQRQKVAIKVWPGVFCQLFTSNTEGWKTKNGASGMSSKMNRKHVFCTKTYQDLF